MKQLIFLISVFCAMFLPINHALAQQGEQSNGFVLKESFFDFGKIPQGKPVFHVFEIINTGKSILQIADVQASCGCTTPAWEREPVKA